VLSSEFAHDASALLERLHVGMEFVLKSFVTDINVPFLAYFGLQIFQYIRLDIARFEGMTIPTKVATDD
jgi:hypothetical protein